MNAQREVGKGLGGREKEKKMLQVRKKCQFEGFARKELLAPATPSLNGEKKTAIGLAGCVLTGYFSQEERKGQGENEEKGRWNQGVYLGKMKCLAWNREKEQDVCPNTTA